MRLVSDKMRARMPLIQHFRWKILLLRVAVNALALLATVILIPNLYFVDKTLGSLVLMALILGLLNGLVKPVIQFLTMPFLFASYGLVVVFINALMLAVLAWFFPSRFALHGLLPALLAGAIIGIIASFLENLLGITPPIRHEALGSHQKALSPLGDRVLAKMAQQAAPLGEPASTISSDSEPVEVTDATIVAGQDQGEPAATAGL